MPSVPKDRRLLTRMRRALVEVRNSGIAFSGAWEATLPAVTTGLRLLDANSWRLALEETEDAWRRAYAGERVWKLNGAID